MTLKEYELRLKALRLQNVDESYKEHRQAFLNFSVQAMKPAGKGKQVPVYRTFRKFYDYEKELKRAEGKKQKSRFSGIGKVLNNE